MLQNAKEIETQIKNCEYDAMKLKSVFVRMVQEMVVCGGKGLAVNEM